MRRSTVRLIALRELRDLTRDRRTLLLILGLPIVLYPAFGVVGVVFALSMLDQKIIVGVSGIDQLPAASSHPEAHVAGGMTLGVAELNRRFDDPPLIVDGAILPQYVKSDAELGNVVVKAVGEDGNALLKSRAIDALLVVSPDFAEKLRRGEKPMLTILGREGDETSKLAVKRLRAIVARWLKVIREIRYLRHGLPADFDEPVEIIDPQDSKPATAKSVDELRDMLVKFFPFLLVMWTMAGALHPAIDLTAGEKERGTMETLLISPAERGEIVAGKFIAVWTFSYMSALWNILWMGGGALVLGYFLPIPIVSTTGLIWSAMFAAPLAALFSAVAVGLGVFARSSKEGQYYLMPLFLLTLPLTLWSMTPGMKLTLSLSLVPVTGLSLMLQRLMSVSGERVPVECWLGVILSLSVCVGLSLWWAARQFQRESVLFREARRMSLGGWLRAIFGK